MLPNLSRWSSSDLCWLGEILRSETLRGLYLKREREKEKKDQKGDFNVSE